MQHITKEPKETSSTRGHKKKTITEDTKEVRITNNPEENFLTEYTKENTKAPQEF